MPNPLPVLIWHKTSEIVAGIADTLSNANASDPWGADKQVVNGRRQIPQGNGVGIGQAAGNPCGRAAALTARQMKNGMLATRTRKKLRTGDKKLLSNAAITICGWIKQSA